MDLERFNFPTAGFAMTSLVAQVISQYRCAVSSDILDGDTEISRGPKTTQDNIPGGICPNAAITAATSEPICRAVVKTRSSVRDNTRSCDGRLRRFYGSRGRGRVDIPRDRPIVEPLGSNQTSTGRVGSTKKQQKGV